MTARTRLLTIWLLVWGAAVISFASVRFFWLGVPVDSNAAATGYVAITGTMLMGLIALYKWARRDTDARPDTDR